LELPIRYAYHSEVITNHKIDVDESLMRLGWEKAHQ